MVPQCVSTLLFSSHLQQVDDLMVDWQLARGHLVKVRVDLIQLLTETFETHQLVGDSLRQGTDRRVFDVSAKPSTLADLNSTITTAMIQCLDQQAHQHIP